MDMYHKNNNEEWLKLLKNSVKDYRETLPDGGWQRLERELYAPKLPRRTVLYRVLGGVSAVAAVVLLFFAVRPFLKNEESVPALKIAVVEEKTPAAEQTLLSEQIPAGNDFQSGSTLVKQSVGRSSKKMGQIGSQTGQSEKPEGVSLLYNDAAQCVTSTLSDESKQDAATVSQVENIQNKGNKNASDKDISGKDASKKEIPGKEITWEEYLSREEKQRGESTGGLGKWLAFSVGNNGIGSFNTRSAELSRAVRQDMPLMSDSPANNMNAIQDMTYKHPGNMTLKAGVNTIIPEYNHKQPISFGVTFGKNISEKFTVETGVVYSLLLSDIKNMEKDKNTRQTLHYIGIPMRFNWNFISQPKYAVYTGVGGLIEKCVYGTIGNEKLTIKSVQGAVTFAVGAQYKFNKNVGIYFEPGMCYYLGMEEDGSLGKMSNGTSIKSIHSQNPLGFTLQAGLRFSF